MVFSRHCYNRAWSHCLQFYVRATLAMSYIPRDQREARVIFIFKQSKVSYVEVKSYQPINLTSFLFKTLENILDKHIRDLSLVKLPLHENQYAYQASKSCKQAIHEFALQTEIAIGKKEVASATYLDIKGVLRWKKQPIYHLHQLILALNM